MAKRSSIGEKFQSEVNKCDICFSGYDRNLKQPLIICSLHHTVCKQCLKDLEASQKCPFCREKLDFKKIVLNNYIFNLLPSESHNKSASFKLLPPPVHFPSLSSNNQNNFQQNYLNNFQASYIPAIQSSGMNPPAISANRQMHQIAYEPQNNEHENNFYNSQVGVNQQVHQLYGINHLHLNQPYRLGQLEAESNLEELSSDDEDSNSGQGLSRRFQHFKTAVLESPWRKLVYFGLLLQIPYIIIDLTISQNAQPSECMDTPHNSDSLILRGWLKGIGFASLAILILSIFGPLLYLSKVINQEFLKKIQIGMAFMLTIKMLIWISFEVELFFFDIVLYCTGVIYAYGLFLLILHGIMCFTIAILYSRR